MDRSYDDALRICREAIASQEAWPSLRMLYHDLAKLLPQRSEWQQQVFVLLAEIRQCINDDRRMAAQRKIIAIESLVKEFPETS